MTDSKPKTVKISDENLATKLAADCAYQSRLLVRLRDELINIKDGIEDEGDRAYFGSTNDKDDFKEIVNEVDSFKWERIIPNTRRRDLYAEMRELRAAVAAAERERDALKERVERLEAALKPFASHEFADVVWDTDYVFGRICAGDFRRAREALE